ncbi:MAG: SDR family oxidoreductase [Planctomycetota bacterium]|nr:SDR family oxidoreductase [Planctomycetota bacterium]
MDNSLQGKVALVTGAGRGIGRATSIMLAEHGATAIMASRTRSDLESAASEITNAGGTAVWFDGDVTDQKFVDYIFEETKERFGRLDILVNNAGMAPFGKIEDLPLERFRACLELNVVAAFHCMQLAVRLMKENGDVGKIINIGSVRSHWTEAGGDGAYNASKYGLRGLTETVARQLHGSGSNIAVSLICPGGVATTLVSNTPNPNMLKPEQVAEAILYAATAPPGVNIYDVTLFITQQRPW